MSNQGIAIRGMGIISALGVGTQKNAEKMRQRCDGLSPLSLFPHPKIGNYPVCEIASYPASLAHRCDQLAQTAIDEAFQNAGATRSKNQNRMALVLGNTTVDLLEQEEKARPYFEKGDPNPPAIFGQGTMVGEMSRRLAKHYGIKGPILTCNTSCSSSANAILQGMNLILTNQVDRVLAVGVDSLTTNSFYGFAALGLLDFEGCRPFDKDRNGIQLGEGAAALILEKIEKTSLMDDHPILKSGANGFDAYHPTASTPDGSAGAKVMQLALTRAGVSGNKIEAIKAHGTGTPNNDLAEANGFSLVFGQNIPPFTSLERYFGHTMAASGAMELVAFLSCIKQGFIPENLGYLTNDPSFEASPLTAHQSTQGGLFLFNSFGFGGTCISLVIQV